MNKNYELLFESEEKKGRDWSLKFIKHFYNMIDGYQDDFNNEYTSYINENSIFTILCNLCNPYSDKVFRNHQITKLDNSHIVENYNIDIQNKNKIIKIQTTEMLIKAVKLSGKIKGISDTKYYSLKNYTDPKSEYNNLIQISKNLDQDNKIVTGYVYGESNKVKKIHSWIEIKNKNEEYVIDFYNNIIMNKQGYYYLNHVEFINEVSSKNIKDDEEIFNDFNKVLKFNIQEYLTFRDYMMKDLEKNKIMRRNYEHK